MRLSAICIERPVLTTVMSLIIVLFGAIALPRLPNRELPDVDPPVVSVTTIYPGAAAEVVETSVTQALEDVRVAARLRGHSEEFGKCDAQGIAFTFFMMRFSDGRHRHDLGPFLHLSLSTCHERLTVRAG